MLIAERFSNPHGYWLFANHSQWDR